MNFNGLARRLTRLYPRAWRRRYEDELLALVEQMGLGPDRAFDLVLGAVREWVREVTRLCNTRPGFRLLTAFVMTAVITAFGLTVAFWLRANVVTPPAISYIDGQRAVLPPRLPSYLAASWYLVVVMTSGLETRMYYRARKGRKPAVRLRAPQALGWLAALALTMPLALWGSLVAHYGTGLPPAHGMQIGLIVLLTFNSLQALTSRLGEPAGPLSAN